MAKDNKKPTVRPLLRHSTQQKDFLNKKKDEDWTSLLNILEDAQRTRRKAERERDRTYNIINNLTDGLIVLDNKDKIVFVNSKIEELLNIKKIVIEGKNIKDISEIPTLKEIVESIVSKAGEKLFKKEISLEKPNEKVLEATIVNLVETDERVIILHDITREKIVEKMKTEFVSISAHQLRTPLSAIKWTLRMLIDGEIGEITPEQKIFLEKTYKSNERMIALIKDLLNVTRIEEGRYLYNPIITDLDEIILKVISSFPEQIKKKKIKLEFKKAEERLPKVRVDIEKITIALQNLLGNAIRYSFPGGEVTIFLESSENEVICSIKDEGVGIPKDQYNRIFTKFFRGANVMRMETEGTGLGLFITKNIIDAHKGRIWFESEENKGTTFYFALPI